MNEQIPCFWNISAADLSKRLLSSSSGLTDEEAKARLKLYGANTFKDKKKSDSFYLFLSQFKSPIVLILIFAALLSGFLKDKADAIIIMFIILASGFLGFWQEKGASDAVEKLLAIVKIKTLTLRGGKPKEIPLEDIVPGDVVKLKAGDVVPADCLILDSKDLFVDEAAFTGETYPAEKEAGILAQETPLAERTNALWMGTHVISGEASVLVARTGKETEFGKISENIRLKHPETEFERGVRRFGYFLMEITLVLVIAIFAINVYLHKPVLESFMFSLALAVGLTPQLLPAIISINLAHGAKKMAAKKVIVKRLASIENFGSMNVLCSDKTGTLTEGIVHLNSAVDVEGAPNEKVLLYAGINASYETGFINPIDEAVRRENKADISEYEKADEIPYDFIRKRLTIVAAKENEHIMITKGALSKIIDVCSSAEVAGGKIVKMEEVKEIIQKKFMEFSGKGLRVLGIAYKNLGDTARITIKDENDMIFLGFLVFSDQPKANILKTLNGLKALGISVKIITGDNRVVAENIAKQIGISDPRIITGSELHEMKSEALYKKVNDIDIFAEVEPNHKELIILALKKSGNVVGYIGDGINDAAALHAADVSMSVESAVDVAKEAADIVLLEKDLSVLEEGVREGRMTFANTLKYVFMATSANFGNMFSMAGASLFLSFLPLLPKQVLLTNLMTDFPEMTIATDNVDKEVVEKPRRWDINFIRKFMMTFGILSSVFDYLAFGAFLFIFHSTVDQFRTAWLMESVISAAMIVLVIRSRKPFFKSKPGKYLLATTILIVAITLILPFTPVAGIFGLTALPLRLILMIGLIVLLYIISAEITKKIFYGRVKF